MADVKGLIRDPRFQSLSFEKRHQLLSKADPRFKELEPPEQVKILNDMKRQPWWNPAPASETALTRKTFPIQTVDGAGMPIEGDLDVEEVKRALKPVPAQAAVQVARGYGGKLQQFGEDPIGFMANTNPITREILSLSDKIGYETIKPDPDNAITRAGKSLIESADAAERGIEEAEPLAPNSGWRSVRSGLASAYQQLPFLAFGGAAASGAKALGMGVNAVKGVGLATSLLPMGEITEGDTYARLREKGFSPDDAGASAYWDKVFEIGTEMIPTGRYLNLISARGKYGLKQVASTLMRAGAEEYVGESIATITQKLNELYMGTPGMTPEQRQQTVDEYLTGDGVWKDLADTFKTTTVQNVAMAVLGLPFAGGRGSKGPVNKAAGEPPAAPPKDRDLLSPEEPQTALPKKKRTKKAAAPAVPGEGLPTVAPDTESLLTGLNASGAPPATEAPPVIPTQPVEQPAPVVEPPQMTAIPQPVAPVDLPSAEPAAVPPIEAAPVPKPARTRKGKNAKTAEGAIQPGGGLVGETAPEAVPPVQELDGQSGDGVPLVQPANEQDERYSAAVALAQERGDINIPALQAKLGIGYVDAASLMDRLEDDEVIDMDGLYQGPPVNAATPGVDSGNTAAGEVQGGETDAVKTPTPAAPAKAAATQKPVKTKKSNDFSNNGRHYVTLDDGTTYGIYFDRNNGMWHYESSPDDQYNALASANKQGAIEELQRKHGEGRTGKALRFDPATEKEVGTKDKNVRQSEAVEDLKQKAKKKATKPAPVNEPAPVAPVPLSSGPLSVKKHKDGTASVTMPDGMSYTLFPDEIEDDGRWHYKDQKGKKTAGAGLDTHNLDEAVENLRKLHESRKTGKAKEKYGKKVEAPAPKEEKKAEAQATKEEKQKAEVEALKKKAGEAKAATTKPAKKKTEKPAKAAEKEPAAEPEKAPETAKEKLKQDTEALVKTLEERGYKYEKNKQGEVFIIKSDDYSARMNSLTGEWELYEGKAFKGQPEIDGASVEDILDEMGWDKGSKSNIFSRPGEPIKKDDVHSLIDPVLKRWAGAPETKVVQDEQELPYDILQDIASQNAWGHVGGVFNKDLKTGKVTIWLVASNIRSTTEALRTLFHEVVGHHGIRGVLGKRIVPVLKDIYAYYGAAGLQDIARVYQLDLSRPQDRLVAADEKLAQLAETNEKPVFVNRAIAAFRDFLRQVGVNVKWNDNDIRALLARAQGWVERGKAAERGEGGARFSIKTTEEREADARSFDNPAKPTKRGKLMETLGLEVYHGNIVGAPKGISDEKSLQKMIDRLVVFADQHPMSEVDSKWYSEVGRMIREISHGDEKLMEQMSRVLAYISIEQSVQMNAVDAIKSAYLIARGDRLEIGRYPKVAAERLPAVLSAPRDQVNGDLPGIGPKVEAFYRNIRDNAFQVNEFPGASTIDRHMARMMYATKDEDPRLTHTQNGFCQAVMKEVTRRYNHDKGTNLLPHQLQAVLWGAQLNKGKAKEDVSKAWNYPEFIKQATFHVTLETRPSESVPGGLEIAKLSFEDMIRFHKEAMSIFMKGRTNELLEALGGILYHDKTGSGLFEGTIAPNETTGIVSQRTKAISRDKFESYDMTLARMYGRAVQYIFKQDGVPIVRPDYITPENLKKPEVQDRLRGAIVNFESPLSMEQELEFKDNLVKAFGPGAGYTKIAPDQIMLLNFGGQTNAEFYDIVDGIEGTDKNGITSTERFTAEGDYLEHDWKKEPEGKGLAIDGGWAGSPDLQERIDNWRSEYESLVEKWTEQREEAPRRAFNIAGRTGSAVPGNAEGAQEGSGGSSAEPVGGLPVREDGRVELTHWSRREGITELDPSFYGTAMAGMESRRKKEDPKNWVDRTYYAVNGAAKPYKKESGLGPHRYTASVDPSELYDFDKDPDNLKAKSVDWGKLSATLYEKNIKDAGYRGFWALNPQLGTVAAVFDRVTTESYVNEVAPRTPSGTTLDFMGMQTAYNMLKKLGKPTKEALKYLVDIGKFVYAEGKKSLKAFTDGMKKILKGLYPTFRSMMAATWSGVRMAAASPKQAAKAAVNAKKGWDEWWTKLLAEMGGMPGRREYLGARYALEGLLDKINEDVETVFKTLSKAWGTPDEQALQKYFTDKNGDPNTIANPEVRAMAIRAKQTIEDIGDRLVAKGWLKLETHEATRGEYLPRVYLKHLLGPKLFAEWTGGKKLDKRYLKKRRQDLSEDFRNIILGQVTDVAYLASRAISLPLRDLAVGEWLQTIAADTQFGWVLPKSLVKWKLLGQVKSKPTMPQKLKDEIDRLKDKAKNAVNDADRKMYKAAAARLYNGWRAKNKGTRDTIRVTPFWLKSEAARLREQALYMNDINAQRAKAEADQMDRIANAVLAASGVDPNNIDAVPDGYRRLPDSPRYGVLKGMVVKANIYADIVGTGDIKMSESTLLQALLGAGYKYTAWWKFMKAVANFPGQVRNMITNMSMLHLSGIPMLMVPVRVAQAVHSVITNGKYWQAAKRGGVRSSTFANVELGRAEDQLKKYLERKPQQMSWMSLAQLLVKPLKALGRFAGDMYQFMEAVSKTAMIIHEMEHGKSERDAVIAAHDAVIDYSLVPQFVRHARQSPFGAPFLTFLYAASKRVLLTAATKPWRFIPYLMLTHVLPQLIVASIGDDDEDLKTLRMALNEWFREKGSMAAPFPYKDAYGRWQFVDLSYFFAWTPLVEVSKAALKLDLGGVIQKSTLFQGPILGLISAMVTGKDSFTQKDIVEELEPTMGEQAKAWLAFLYRHNAPTMFTSQGAYGKLMSAHRQDPDIFGDPKYTYGQAAWAAVGVNMYPLDPEKSREYNINQYNRRVQKLRAARSKELKKLPLTSTEQDRQKVYEKYERKVAKVYQEQSEYIKASLPEGQPVEEGAEDFE